MQQVKQLFNSSALLQSLDRSSKMEPIRAEPLCLKDAAPQDDGYDECDTPSMQSRDNFPDEMSIGPMPNLV